MNLTDKKGAYLIFELNNEVYGTKLLDTREVIEPIKTKPIPNTEKYFQGVINIRGEIVGVIDLRILYGHQETSGPFKAFLVVETSQGPIATVVDKVLSVTHLEEEDIDGDTIISSLISDDDIIGIAKKNNQLITLVNLPNILATKSIKYTQRAS